MILVALMFGIAYIPLVVNILLGSANYDNTSFYVQDLLRNIGPLFIISIVLSLLFLASKSIWIPVFFFYFYNAFYFNNVFVMILIFTLVYYGMVWYIKNNTDFKFKKYL